MLPNQWDTELQRHSLTGLFQRAPTPSWLGDLAKIFFDMYLLFKVSLLVSWVTENSPLNKRLQQHKNTCEAEKCLMFGSKLSWVDSLCLLKPTILVWAGAAKWKRPPPNQIQHPFIVRAAGIELIDGQMCVRARACVCLHPIKVIISR